MNTNIMTYNKRRQTKHNLIKISRKYKNYKKLYNKMLIDNYKYNMEHTTNDDDEEDETELEIDNKKVYCKDNNIYFRDDVKQESIDELISIIDQINYNYNNALIKANNVYHIEPKPYNLWIMSYGGSLFQGFRAYDAIKRSFVKINTIVDGYAASAASIMSIAGNVRYITPNSFMLIHQLSSTTSGKYYEIKDDVRNFEEFMNKSYKLYELNTNLSRSKIEELLKSDIWFNSDLCLEYGLIDELYTSENYATNFI